MPDIDALIDRLKEVLPPPSSAVRDSLVPMGKLRAGINLSNFLLVTGRTADDKPEGVSPGMARALAAVIDCPVAYVAFDSPGAVADAAEGEGWDIGNIGADPARAAHITFTDAYCEIEATCLVPGQSALASAKEIDRPGLTIATKARAAYTLWLERHIQEATLLQFPSMEDSFDAFATGEANVLAGLRPRLLDDAAKLPGSVVLPGKFTAVQQAIGVPSSRGGEAAVYVQRFAQEAKMVGLVQALIDAHGVTGKLTPAAV